ncbi:MAG: NUDIX hydrolase [Actinomycetes bacterium]
MRDDHRIWTGEVADQPVDYPVLAMKDQFVGRIWKVRTDTVQIGQDVVDRDVVIHTGAVVVLALDHDDRVYLLRQYRHPVGMLLFEPVAGLIDKLGESPLETARREFAEEAGMVADRWDVLVDFFNTPGGSSEAIRVYLARDIKPRHGGRIMTGEAEERSLPGVWVPLDEAVSLVLSGKLGNPASVIGVLAAAQAKARGWSTLRPADCPWTVREHLVETGRVHTSDLPAD